MSDLTEHDRDMIKHAMHRGPVLVTHDGVRKPAILIAWRRHKRGRHTGQCVVQYTSGRPRVVSVDQISLPEGVTR